MALEFPPTTTTTTSFIQAKQYEWWSSQLCVFFSTSSSSSSSSSANNSMKCTYSVQQKAIHIRQHVLQKFSATKHFWIYTIQSLCDIDLWHVCMDCDIIHFVCFGRLFVAVVFFSFRFVYKGKRRMKSYFCKRANAVVFFSAVIGRNVQMNSMAA